MGGVNQVTFLVKGDDAWSHLKYEGGPHRVQRVPVTESQGRVHTSSATVTVLPEAEEVDVQIEDKDLKIDVYRSTGPGGQSVNTTDSAVRITHLPTGIVVAMQDEKSQIQNRAKAMQVLRARLLKAEQDRQAAELSSARRSQVGGGGRSEKIRTYNYKENRVTDHRIGLTLYKLDKILLGELDELVEALMADERTRQLAGAEDRADVGWTRGRPSWTGDVRPDLAQLRRRGRGSPRVPTPRPAGWSRRSPASGGRPRPVSDRDVTPGPGLASPRWSSRRAAGEPLQYVLGRWAFRTLDLMVDRRVLIPRPETEQVVEVGPGRARSAGGGHRSAGGRRGWSRSTWAPGRAPSPWLWPPSAPACEVWATDVSPGALEVAGANLAGLGGRAAARVRLARGSWWAALPERPSRAGSTSSSRTRRTSRPQRWPAWTPRWWTGSRGSALEAGPTGLEAVQEILAGARRWLRPGGSGGGRDRPPSIRQAAGLARDAGLARVEVRPDLAGRDRALVARRAPMTVGAAPPAATPPPARRHRRRRRRPCGAATSSAIPTDTVYGLAADPWHSGAADRLFRVKGRPRSVELPVLVAGEEQALELATAVPDCARRLMARFWPGALTIVLPRRRGRRCRPGRRGRDHRVALPGPPGAAGAVPGARADRHHQRQPSRRPTR